MIINPLLYCFSSKEIDKQLIARLSQITTTEREIMNKFKMKFAIITTVFYVCWLPNLINGVILWSAWVKLPVKFVVFNWYVMVSWYDYTFDVDVLLQLVFFYAKAITNPLQAFFNALVYRKWDSAYKITEMKSPVVGLMLCQL
jgi:ocular albinism type 1 protein